MWASSGSWPHDGPDEDYVRRMSPPENEIPVALPGNAALARTADAALALTEFRVYSTGVTFTQALRVRRGRTGRRDIHELLWRQGDGAPGMLVGLELADGRRVDDTDRQGPMGDLVFSCTGGSGDELSLDQGWWLHPLPPQGPLRLVVRFDDLGISETVTELDGGAIREAAGEVTELWPYEPPQRHTAEPEEGAADVPPDSWFARP